MTDANRKSKVKPVTPQESEPDLHVPPDGNKDAFEAFLERAVRPAKAPPEGETSDPASS